MGACPSDLAGPTPGSAPGLAKAANDASIKEQIAEFKDLADKITTTTTEAGTLLAKLGPDTRIPPSVRRPVSKTVLQIVYDMGVENDKFKVNQSTIVNISSKLALSTTSPLSEKELASLLKEAKDAVSSARAVLPILEAKLAKIRAIDAYVSGTPPPPPTGPALDPAALSIASIDAYLTAKYPPIAAVDNMPFKEIIGKRVPFDRFNAYIFGNYETITTSINKNDCLVHSVLAGISSVFRKLTNAQKDEFADYFRRTILPKTKQYSTDNPGRIPLLTSGNFLEDPDVEILKNILNVSILSFESAVSGVLGNPGVADFFREGLSEVYMIFNPGNFHFETVRVNGTGNYTIPVNTARDIMKVVMEDIIKSAYAAKTDVSSFDALEKEGFPLPPKGTADIALFQKAIADEIEAAKRRLTTAPGRVSTRAKRRVATKPGGRRRTHRKRRGGNPPTPAYQTQTEKAKEEVKKLGPPTSPGVTATAAKLLSELPPKSLPRGGRRRTFRKKKTLREVEKKLDELKELISRSS